MDQIQYYPITIVDYSDVFEFWRSIEGLIIHNDFSESEKGFSLFLDRNPGLSLVAKYENKIIGAILCSHDGRRGFFNHLAVSNNFQSKGIGRELVTKSIKALKAQNIHKTMVPVLKSNIHAQKFWQKIGFTQEETIEMHSKVH